MITEFLLRLRILPRWVIILLDLFIIAFSTFLAYLLRFNFDFTELTNFNYGMGIVVNTLSCLLALFITKSYSGIVRYTGLKDGLRLFYTLVITHLFSALGNLIYFYYEQVNFIPFSIILISFLASFVFMFQYRLLIKNIFSYYRNIAVEKKNVAIFGAGQMGILTKHLFDSDAQAKYKVVAFFEDNLNKVGKEINGTDIYAFDNLEKVQNREHFDEMILAVQNLSLDRKNQIVDECIDKGIKIRTVPSFENWVRGELKLSQIKEVNIDDLLERESIKLNNAVVIEQLRRKRICVTGAAGSIGSELVKQIITYKPEEVILIDQAESGLYEVYRDLVDAIPASVKIVTYVADITDAIRMRHIFDKHEPQIIYHAAAYKQVPIMEDNVAEAIKCNVLGTKILADLAVEYLVEKFVMVSTDKAVNPTNVMGCTKRVAEVYVQSLNDERSTNANTKFVTTRFGNVLGSNGSVIPYFKKQIDLGGPITVTHPEITRYFMTISEACELVIEAGAMGNGGEIFLFDMGKSVKIVDLAKKMIRLSGYKPYDDIDIVFTGLRKGEKLYEELLANEENSLPTHHNKIMIAKVNKYDYEKVKYEILAMAKLIYSDSTVQSNDLDKELVIKLKKMIPEYKSQSSRFKELDQ